MGESGGIPALLGHDTFGSRLFHPSLRREHKAVQACLTFNCLEFEVIELGVVEMLPQAQETDGVPRPHPVLDNISWILGRPVFGYVCQVEGVLAVTVGVIETDTFVVTVGTETAFWTFRESEWAAL